MISIRDAGSTYLLTFRNGKRLNPRTSMSSIWHVNFFCTVVAIWNYFQSNMYGSAKSEPSSEQGRRKLTSHWSSRWINQFSCQFLMDCFVHERCIPQQNSQWCFWASVCDTSWHPDLKLSFDVVWSSLISQKTFIWDLPTVMANASQGANFLGVKDAQGVRQIFRVYSSSCIRPDPRKFTPQPQL